MNVIELITWAVVIVMAAFSIGLITSTVWHFASVVF